MKNMKLKLQIIKKFMTQADFAEALNVNEFIISKVVCGRRELPEKKKKLWAKTLDCNVNEIFGGKGA